MKKAILRILCLLLGLNVFTACYGPAMPPDPADHGLDQIRLDEKAVGLPEVEDPSAADQAPEEAGAQE